MRIIPVLDLLGGVVVAGTGGRRDAYRPIATPLAASADPVAVAGGLLGVTRAQAVYLADLDAIEGRPGQGDAVAALLAAFPARVFWIDAGFRTQADLAAIADEPRLRPVLGSETAGPATLAALAGPERAILSLDFRGETFLGDPAILAEPACWPPTLIVMTLARVGSGAGPDLARLAEIVARAGGRRVFAAGGVREREDLAALQQIGAAGALVSSALHAGTLKPLRDERKGP